MELMIRTSNGVYEIDPDDCYIRNHMMSGQVFESHIINGSIIPKYISNAKYVVDVGANIGCHGISYAHANPNLTVWAFEPQKRLCNILRRNVVQNNLSDRVNVYDCGIGHTSMECQLSSLDTVQDKNHNGWNKAGLGIGQGGEKMSIRTLDSFDLPGLDFIKIDVEGAEGLVIRGAQETLKKYKPVVFFEHNYQRINPNDVGLDYVPTPFEELVKIGYKKFEYIDWENYVALFW